VRLAVPSLLFIVVPVYAMCALHGEYGKRWELPPFGGKAVETKNKPPEMKNFDEALRRVLRVTKHELKELLAEDKAANADKSKRGPKPNTA
jgi:hypothetical protein